MTGAFDPRILKVGVRIDGAVTYFQDLDIRVQGQRFFSETAAFCTIKISNLTRAQRNWLLTNATPIRGYTKEPAALTVDVGRKDKWLFRLFEGLCYASTVTQPPDVGVIFRSLDSSGLSSALQPNSLGAIVQLRTIAQYVADNASPKLTLDFGPTPDRQIANFSFPANTNDLVPRLNQLGGIVATVNNGTLVVRPADGFNRDRGFVLSQETGMVGVPQATESGVIAQMLARPDIQIGDLVTIKSLVNPSVSNIPLRVSQIAFDLANRDTPFFFTLTLTTLFIPNSPPGTL